MNMLEALAYGCAAALALINQASERHRCGWYR
jgi:hypothetical protein